MKVKGFTLIELLAVIVILAIIALIAIPIVLNIIKDTKEESKKISAENYLSAVEQAIVKRNIKEEFKPTICIVISEGLDCEGYNEPLKVEVDGEAPTSGTIYFSNDKVSNGTLLNFDGYTKKINNLAKENVKAATEETKTTGIIPVREENGNIKPGSEFKIKVSDNIKDENGEIAEYTFFVLSNSEDGKYVNLIAEQNIAPDGKFTIDEQDNDEWYITESNQCRNTYGPQYAYTYLSKAISSWINIPIIENFSYFDEGNQTNSSNGYQSIITSLNETTGKYITIITPNPNVSAMPVTYENLRAHLPKYGEVIENTDCKIPSSSEYDLCPLWMKNYLPNGGYWLLTSNSYDKYSALRVSFQGYISAENTYYTYYGIRPVITVLKSDLLRVM